MYLINNLLSFNNNLLAKYYNRWLTSECYFFRNCKDLKYFLSDLVRPGFDLNKIGLTSITWDLRASSKSSKKPFIKTNYCVWLLNCRVPHMRFKLFINIYFFSSSNEFFLFFPHNYYRFHLLLLLLLFFRVYIPLRLPNGLRGNNVGQTAIGLYCSKLGLLINLDWYKCRIIG